MRMQKQKYRAEKRNEMKLDMDSKFFVIALSFSLRNLNLLRQMAGGFLTDTSKDLLMFTFPMMAKSALILKASAR